MRLVGLIVVLALLPTPRVRASRITFNRAADGEAIFNHDTLNITDCGPVFLPFVVQ
jgi:hypothetical protein